jgi:methylenetetrahydrofolate dehydrogenase (NADP+) / methenyltetrahydrofolate cyclohydrolase
MLVMSGKTVSEKKRLEIKIKVRQFTFAHGRPPGLAVVIVGDDPASHVYVKNKVKACVDTGIHSIHMHLPGTVSEEELLQTVAKLNTQTHVDAILVQMPLPKHINTERVISAIWPLKDADGLTPENLGLLTVGRPRVSPCTPHGVIEILKHYDVPISGRHAVVVGRSQIVGRPMAQLFLLEDAAVTVVHSKTENMQELTRLGDIVVVAAGKPRFLGAADFKKNAVVVDVGIHRLFDGLCGDVRTEELNGHAAAVTPVPGGVGPMTITMLLENTLVLAQLSKINTGR